MAETLAIKADFERFDEWTEAFRPGNLELVHWDDLKAGQPLDYALVWYPEPGALHRHPGLKIIFSVGAGLDHLVGENILPPGIPVVRMVETALTLGMAEYVVYHVLRHHRFMPQYEQFQRDRAWEEILQIPANQRTVGILGMGVLGTACAQALMPFGFSIIGWSRTEKRLEGVEHYHGADQLDRMISRCDYLVCLLPYTRATRHILRREHLRHLPEGAVLINVGRGGLQVEDDLIEMLDSGHLGAAVLDVFEKEPLPPDNPLWSHPRVTITPHVASMTLPETSARHVLANIERCRAGLPLTHVADMARGY
ncbi:MAG: glyoxylate/hydroxypyruvate reductase A [Gammaproteobacteria bacterium]|nr:glyoxylate/hydroxypyruvate reductase A [Gammaproteobacteria bacterium]MYD76511.1 glyoxylate/hydroxypyruvate reductase A [Gammaproteobacteria bacterium]MYJ51916.1 glyoxylate/hydroxypyruvate reductase A [Gammaproteobacteria bacterium]